MPSSAASTATTPISSIGGTACGVRIAVRISRLSAINRRAIPPTGPPELLPQAGLRCGQVVDLAEPVLDRLDGRVELGP